MNTNYETPYEMTERVVRELSERAKVAVTKKDFVGAQSYIKEAKMIEEIYTQGVIERSGIDMSTDEAINLATMIINAENALLRETEWKYSTPVKPELKQVQIMSMEGRTR